MMVAAAVILLRSWSIYILCFTFSGIVGIGVASAVEREAPEPAGEHASQRLVKEGQDLIAVANGHAAVAGASVLRAGGSALDAAIAAQLVLNLVEPQSSGMGGGAFLLYFDSTSRELISYDGRETAPASAQPDMFLHSDGTAPTYLAALVGGNSVGAPGLLRMLSLAHKNHGRLSWARLFTPAIDIADSGFAISPRLHTLIAKVPTLNQFENTANYFFTPDGFPKAVGTKLTNESFAQTLRELAVGGAEIFYRGPIAQDIAETVALAGVNPGGLTALDIADYRPFVRPPVCLDYRGFLVCGMGPPSSGGIAVLQILGLLSNFDLGSMKPWSADAAHLFLEASRLAFADRSRYVADPDFVRVPVNGLLDQ
ncbi:MAG: Gamma-glutamyltranspeptidase, partial [Alphaproteobacteria bacterium MarineAlpha9_Bin7]